MFKKPYEDGFQLIRTYWDWKICKIYKVTSRLNAKSHVLTFLEAIL
jgi:hypothetical protein